MGSGIKPADYNSHPGIPLSKHTSGVIEGTKKRTAMPIAELAATFHDIGKLNPHFQAKLRGENPNGYSGHAYLSAFAWFCFLQHESNREFLKKFLGASHLNQKIASVAVTIAHHHGNLPNLGSEGLFKKYGFEQFLTLFDQSPNLPVSDYLQFLFQHQRFSCTLTSLEKKRVGEFSLRKKDIGSPLDFFLDTRFAFASMIAADKMDASRYVEDTKKIKKFTNSYNKKLNNYLRKFKPDSELNRLRTSMRQEAITNLNQVLSEGKRVFSLTAPTGAGKTLTLLSLAGEILKQKGVYRVIYSLPFLSITEQVEKECIKIFGDKDIYRIDSKAEDKEFSKLIEQLDSDPQVVQKLVSGQFAEKLFDYPFIITTFVRFFETLVSHRNATLLKLPNFSRAIFLIDEIQALPPRLYGFFVALLNEFCRKFNSYAVISTATMPNFELPIVNPRGFSKPTEIFPNYQTPLELLSPEYFSQKPFQRYEIQRVDNKMEIKNLSAKLKQTKIPTMVILNTIQDTKDLYQELKKNRKCILLNTHFIPIDREQKIKDAQKLLNHWNKTQSKPFTLITTQLIEAGVDIDFPSVYRDMAPLPNIIQSAGRCNRNNNYRKKGAVKLIELVKNNVPRSRWVYGKDSYKEFLEFPRRELTGHVQETDLLKLQKKFFTKTKDELLFGVYKSKNKEINFLEAMQLGNFSDIGNFRLIDKQDFGEGNTYYVPDKNDKSFTKLLELQSKFSAIPYRNFDTRKALNIAISALLRKMNKRILNINLKPTDSPPIFEAECFDIKLISADNYNSETGIKLDVANQII